jgi:hypothetical protein
VSGKIVGAGHQRKGEVSQTSADRTPGERRPVTLASGKIILRTEAIYLMEQINKK